MERVNVVVLIAISQHVQIGIASVAAHREHVRIVSLVSVDWIGFLPSSVAAIPPVEQRLICAEEQLSRYR
jgi:hypothetical protein